MKSFKQYVSEGSAGVQRAKRKEKAAYKKSIKSTVTPGVSDEAIASAEDASLEAKRKLELINRRRAPRAERAALRFAQHENKPTDPNRKTRDVMTDMQLNMSHFEDGDISPRLKKQAQAMRKNK